MSVFETIWATICGAVIGNVFSNMTITKNNAHIFVGFVVGFGLIVGVKKLLMKPVIMN